MPFCPRSEFELLADALVFDPNHLATFSRSDHQSVPALARDFSIREPILELHVVPQADRLKTISRLPVTQDHSPADLVGVEDLGSARGGRPERAAAIDGLPAEAQTVEAPLPGLAVQFHRAPASFEPHGRNGRNGYVPRRVTSNGGDRAYRDRFV